MVDLKDIYDDIINDIQNMSEQDFKNEMEENMKSYDLNNIKDKEQVFVSSKEALKDVCPFENDLDLDQIKQLYCKFKCKFTDKTLILHDEDGKIIDTYSACDICQWDSIIKELQEFNKISK